MKMDSTYEKIIWRYTFHYTKIILNIFIEKLIMITKKCYHRENCYMGFIHTDTAAVILDIIQHNEVS